jgi:hypothetical protein
VFATRVFDNNIRFIDIKMGRFLVDDLILRSKKGPFFEKRLENEAVLGLRDPAREQR